MKISEGKRYCRRPVRKSKDKYTEAMTEDSTRLLGTTGLKILALDQKILGRKSEEAQAWNLAVVDRDFKISIYM